MTPANMYGIESKFKNKRVRVIRQHRYGYLNLIGKTGTVINVYGSQITVLLDDIRNDKSCRGYFYLSPNDLQVVNECENDITEENNMYKITNYVNVAKVRFVDTESDCEHGFANFDPYINVGDLCVVKTVHGLTLAKIVEIIDRNDLTLEREIVAKVNTDAYDLRVETRAKAAELKSKMQERAKQLQDIALYRILAKDDPEMLKLLSEYHTLPIA